MNITPKSDVPNMTWAAWSMAGWRFEMFELGRIKLHQTEIVCYSIKDERNEPACIQYI